MMLRTTVLGLALTLAACADHPAAVQGTSSTAASVDTTTTTAPRFDRQQLVGAWQVASAGAAAPFAARDLLTFLSDGTYLSDGATDGGGTWTVSLGSVLILDFRGAKWSYNVRPAREELHLDGLPGSFMALARS